MIGYCLGCGDAVARRRPPTDYEIVNGITLLAGDGYCLAADLIIQFKGFDRRAFTKALRRAANRGLLLERQGPNGRRYVAVAADGWRLIEAQEGPL